MDVIGDRKLRFRVNGRPTLSGRSPKNYGSVHELSAMSAGCPGQAIPRTSDIQFSSDEIPTVRDRLTGMPGTDILPLLSGHRFETMSATTNKTRFFARACPEETPCRSSMPPVSQLSVRRC